MKKLVNAIFGISIIATSFTTTSCQKEDLQPTYIVDTVKMNQFEDSVRKELAKHSDTIYIQIADTNKIDYSKPLVVTYETRRTEYAYDENGNVIEELVYENNILKYKSTYVYNGKTCTRTCIQYDGNGNVYLTTTSTVTYK